MTSRHKRCLKAIRYKYQQEYEEKYLKKYRNDLSKIEKELREYEYDNNYQDDFEDLINDDYNYRKLVEHYKEACLAVNQQINKMEEYIRTKVREYFPYDRHK